MHGEDSSERGSQARIGFYIGLIGFLLLLLLTETKAIRFSYGTVADAPSIGRMFAITWLIAVWWMFEALPIPITSLLPLVLMPFCGIMPGEKVAAQYTNDVIFLFMGGFFLALSLQKWGVHRRLALHIVLAFGGKPSRLLLGFMSASCFLSMWISNTATTMMLLPIALSVTQVYEERLGGADRSRATSLFLGIAYAASVGGIATLVGTPPNLSFARLYQIYFPKAPEITFFEWMKFGLPVALIFLPVVWFVLAHVFFRPSPREGVTSERSKEVDAEIQGWLKGELSKMGSLRWQEMAVLGAFAVTALLWLWRVDLRFGEVVIPGWTTLLGLTVKGKAILGDGTIAMTMAILLFLIPSDRNPERGYLLDWKTASKIPWGMLLLFGGGFALAMGIKDSGMSAWVGEIFRWKGVSSLGVFGTILVICLVITFLTELTSNTATTEIMLAIMAPVAATFGGTGVHPYLLMIPVTISASCAFMLPVATPPNALVYATGYVRMSEMIRVGLVLNLLLAFLLSFLLYFLFWLMGLPLLQKPTWI